MDGITHFSINQRDTVSSCMGEMVDSLFLRVHRNAQ